MTEVFNPSKFYDERVNKYGYSAASVGWKDSIQQNLRFDILTAELDLNNKKILDIGCGFGDLANYLISKEISVQEFIGVDVSRKMLEIAKKNTTTKVNASFLNINVLNEPIDTTVDIALMSGLLNLRQSSENSYEILQLFLSKVSPIVKEALVFNLLTDEVDFKQPHHLHYNPRKTKQIVQNFFKDVSIKKDYGLYEFTVKAVV